MKYKSSLLIFLTLSIMTVSLAQTDKAAKKSIDAVNAKLKSIKGFSASFNTTTTDKNQKKQADIKGTLMIKGAKFYLQMGKAEIICDGKKLWNFDGENEVNISKAEDAAQDWFSPLIFVDGINTKDFSAKIISKNGNVEIVQLTPIDKRKSIAQIILTLDNKQKIITKINLTDKSRNTTIITFNNLNTKVEIPDSKFVFNAKKYPGVEIVEE